MNLVISTEPRLFMAVVGPSGCGKTQYVYQLLLNNAFVPGFDKILYFYKQFQPVYSQMEIEIPNIEFLSGIDFELINDLPNDGSRYLLIFDDSSEEIYENKEFRTIATSGRHRGLHVIYMKHNLFLQSKHSRTIDLNNTHLVLFKNPRDYEQIKVLFQRMGKLKYLKECYDNAIEKPWGHLVLDFLPRAVDLLRYSANSTGSEGEPTIFYLPDSKARIHFIKDEYTTRNYSQALV